MIKGIPVVIKEVWPDCMAVSQVRGIAANGLALTNSELEQLKREIWNAARGTCKNAYADEGWDYNYSTLADYEATKKDGE